MFTILVNSSDGFEDCWKPFFELFSNHWGSCKNPILLNTELKEYAYPGLSIRASKVQLGSNKKLTWSECLIKALQQVETPLVLYFQEDYFIEKKVNVDLINKLAYKMIEDKSIKHIALTTIGSCPPYKETEDPILWEISQNAKYRISTQAALWDKETLLSYLKPEENGWMFEIYGTWRASRKKDIFLAANKGLYRNKEESLIQYEHTGIIKGKWHLAMPKLFENHNIEIDFSKRGFYVPKHPVLEKVQTAKKLFSRPSLLLQSLLNL
jgi:hypothetical protein